MASALPDSTTTDETTTATEGGHLSVTLDFTTLFIITFVLALLISGFLL